MQKTTLVALSVMIALSSCVSKKKFSTLQKQYSSAQAHCEDVQKELDEKKSVNQVLELENVALRGNLNTLTGDAKKKEGELQAKIEAEINKSKLLQENIDYLRKTNTNLLDRLSDMSVVSQTGAENIRKSLEAINAQGAYIKDLNDARARKDSLNLALVMNLKRSLADINDKDVTIEVKKGVVYISISDKMLFASGSSEINTEANKVLGKIAQIINDQKDLDVMVEGHTDNVPIANSCVADNWDLSVKRATSVVRILQTRFGVNPARMTAGGRSEFLPKVGNDTPENRKLNRRTEIILLPKLDQFFQLMEPAKP